jgi:alpha-glucosidase (family GH31 glycosyl hydrolase)
MIQGLFGHPFICPDMIGGGSWTDSSDLVPDFKIDEELFIRWAQLSSMFPMMQFSRAPWKWLSKEAFDLVKKAYDHHMKFIDEIMELVSIAEKTGEPILRNLEYNYPNEGYAEILDEYMLGTELLICPVMTKGARERLVVLPQGKWLDADGEIHEGGCKKILSAPLDKLLWFRRVK